MAKIEYGLTIQDCLNAPIIKQMEKQYGTDEIAMGISLMILKTASFFNLGGNINEDQALETAYLLMGNYPTETLEDFALVFKNAKSGKYGTIYNRLDGQIIFEWMEKHLEAKCEARERLHEQIKTYGHLQDENSVKALEMTEKGRPIIEALKQAVDFEEGMKEKQKDEEFRRFKLKYLSAKPKPEESIGDSSDKM